VSDPPPRAGTAFSFRTAPFSEFAPESTGRYAALKILGSNGKLIVIAVLDSIWWSPPSLDDVRACNILRERRFSFSGRLAVFGINADWWTQSDLDEMTPLGAVSLNEAELQLASGVINLVPGSVLSTIRAANSAAEGEWRWANDRNALIQEQQRVSALKAA
jgi:hypothetical protein